MSDLAAVLLEALDPMALVDSLDGRTLDRLAERLGLDKGPAEDRWLTTAEAAAHIGRTPTALHKLTAARALPFSQDGRGARCYFRRSDLDAWMASR